MPKPKNAISPTREENFPEWYQQIVKAADLAENSEVRGCMVIKPWGYRIWELIQRQLDDRFKATGVENAYFPLLIPVSHLEKEAEHAEGFATECAVVTHHRLEAQKQADGKVKMVPSAELTEPFVVRPTSETVIGTAFSRWVQSYRDLPLLINQWANVMRWEMRPRLFLRTSEFLWQEGHTAHASEQEALEKAQEMHSLYHDFLRDSLAIPTITGEKTEAERFPGAEQTFTVEAMVQDKKAVQAGTSHFLGQNFSRSQDISFQSQGGEQAHAWTTSWGVSTRLIGTLMMTHSDDDGLVLPPRIAAQQIVIIPITPNEDTAEAVLDSCEALATTLRGHEGWDGQPLRVLVDKRDLKGGQKKWDWVKKGVPIRLEIGPKDIASRKVCLNRRDQAANEKQFIEREEFLREVDNILAEIQDNLLARAVELQQENIAQITTLADFRSHWQAQEQASWALVPWEASREEEEALAAEYKISIRCLPDAQSGLVGEQELPCLITGKATKQRALWARSY